MEFFRPSELCVHIFSRQWLELTHWWFKCAKLKVEFCVFWASTTRKNAYCFYSSFIRPACLFKSGYDTVLIDVGEGKRGTFSHFPSLYFTCGKLLGRCYLAGEWTMSLTCTLQTFYLSRTVASSPGTLHEREYMKIVNLLVNYEHVCLMLTGLY